MKATTFLHRAAAMSAPKSSSKIVARPTEEGVEAFFRSMGIDGKCETVPPNPKVDKKEYEVERAKFWPKSANAKSLLMKLNKALGEYSGKNAFGDFTWTVKGKGFVILVNSKLGVYLLLANNPDAK